MHAVALLLIAQTAPIFYAPFDPSSGSYDALYARGDKRIHFAPDYKSQSSAVPGPGEADVAFANDSLLFKSKNVKAVFYKAEGNVSPVTGTISFRLRLNPDKDLAPGYCDPIQITDKSFNDSAIWVDFTKDDKPRHFRLGVFGRRESWNPQKIAEDKFPAFLSRLVVVERPPFASDRWTSVVVAYSKLGTPNGSASLYLDGKLQGTARGISEPFEWDPSKAAIRLGVNYIGLFDELAIFDRELSASEIAALHAKPESLRERLPR